MKNRKRLLALGLAFLMSLSVLSGCGEKEKHNGETLSVCIGETPRTYDPIYAESISDQTILSHMYENLMRVALNSEGEPVVVEGAAKSVTMEEKPDGTVTYSFRLQDGKWSDGVPVRAGDFVYAWQRLANPAFDSPFASLLSIISGYDEARSSGDMSLLAVTAKNSSTLQVTLKGHYDWFLREVCTSPATSPLRQDVLKKLYEAATEQDPDGSNQLRWWTDPTKAVTNGPFTVIKRDGAEALTLTSNPHYHRNRSGPETIVFHFGDAETAQSLFDNNEAEIIAPLTEERMAEMLNENADWAADPELSTYSVLFNGEKLTDDHVRRALSLSIDRNILAKLANVTARPAEGLVPMGVPEGEELFRTVGGSLLDNDPETYADRCEEALSLMESSYYESGYNLGEIEYLYEDSGKNGIVAAALCSMWNRTLSTRITPHGLPKEELMEALNSGDYMLAGLELTAACNDAESFLINWTSTSKSNYIRYGNSAYDTLMAIIIAADGAARFGCLHDAEDLLLNIDCAMTPLYNKGVAWTAKENYTGGIRDLRGWFVFSYVYKKPAV